MKREVNDMAKKRPTKKEEFKPEVYAHKQEYENAYRKANFTQFATRFNNQTEADVIEKLNSVENKRQYILNLIRADIEKSKE